MDFTEEDFDVENLESTEDTQECAVISYDSEFLEEIIIMEIRNRPCLWDQRLDVRLRGLDATKRAWEEISKALGINTIVLQKKWKNLRDTFRRKQQEMKTYVPSGSGAGKKPDQWKFYHLMEFLVPTLEFRKTVSNLSGLIGTENLYSNRETSFVPITTPTNELLLSQSLSSLHKPRITKSASPCLTASSSCSTPSTSNSPLTVQKAFNISPGPFSPASSIVSDKQKRSRRSTSKEPQDVKRICEEEDKFEKFLSLITQKRNEEQIFCNFLQSRLEKLEKEYYMRITHTIIQEVLKIELEQSLNRH